MSLESLQAAIRNKRLLLCAGIVWFVVSCVQDKTDNNLLRQVETCMEQFPDSALSLIKQIQHPEKMQGRQRADYALLLTQVLDKKYLDRLQSDSLITIAVDYYKRSDDKLKAGKAFYYYGKVMASKKRYSDAMQAYLKALTFLEETDDYRMLGLVWEYIGYLNSAQGIYVSSIDNYKKSVECYGLANAGHGVLYGYRNIARGYLAIHNNDSARWYANEGLAQSDTVTKIKSSFLHLLGLIANGERQYSQATDYFLSAIGVSNNMNDKYRCFLSLGRTYLASGKVEQAKEYFLFCRNATNAFISSGAYRCLSNISGKEGDYRKALLYKEKSDSLLEKVHNADLQKQLLTLQSKYENDKLVLENRQVKLEKEKQTYFYLFLLTLVIGVAIVILVYVRKKYQKLYWRNVKIIRNNNQIIEEYACRVADLENAGIQEREAKKEEIGDLNRKITYLTAENKNIRKNSSVDALSVLEELKQGRLIVEKMTVAERQHIFDFLDLVHADFITRLKAEFKLTKTELLMAALLKVGFSNKQLMIVFDCEVKSVYKNRQRLKQDLGLGKDDSLEQMIMMY